MNREQFWQLIESVDQAALEDCDEEGALEDLQFKLEKLPEKEIFDFEENLAQVLHAIDTRKHIENAGESDSDDSFLYARCYVVARGRKFYESVAADPAKMPKSQDQWCESLLYVAATAWEQATGKSSDEWEFDPSVSFETGSNEAGWK